VYPAGRGANREQVNGGGTMRWMFVILIAIGGLLLFLNHVVTNLFK
jgi:hypothetical protein